MSVGVEVDALALMLDGANGDLYRFSRVSVEVLEWGASASGNKPGMARAVAHPEWAEVAEAILQLEAWADWFDSDHGSDRPMARGDLALQARAAVGWMSHPQFEYLEAAALLRDGWRPRKRSKR